MKDQQAYQSIILVRLSLRAEDLRFRVLGGAAVREDSSRLQQQQASLNSGTASHARRSVTARMHAHTASVCCWALLPQPRLCILQSPHAAAHCIAVHVRVLLLLIPHKTNT